jgi:hypothetical protein
VRRFALVFLMVVLGCTAWSADASATFGLHEVGADFSEGGAAATEAGSHPSDFTTSFNLNTTVSGGLEFLDGELKDLEIAQIPGLVGSQTAVPRCTLAEFNTRSEGRPACPDSTAVGIVAVKGEFESVTVNTELFLHSPVYNLAPTRGSAAKLGFIVLNVPIVIEVGVSQRPPYNLIATLADNPQSILLYGAKLTLWGDPADPAHDALRGNCVGEPVGFSAEPVSLGSCPSDAPERAFLTLPRACPGPVAPLFRADSWAQPGVFTEPRAAAPFDATGCDSLGFAPTIEAGGNNQTGDSPSGLDFDLRVDDPGLSDPTGRAASDIERAVVTLPEGFTTNPSVATGLGACSLAQYETEELRFSTAGGCPQSSKVGTVEVTSPLLDETVDGEIFVARQGENVFHSLLTLYMVLRNEENGILIEQPIKVDPNPQTGQLTTTVADIPQLPFSDFHLHFFDGPKAPLITPATCGGYQVDAQLTPYADPAAPVTRAAALSVSAGGAGGCAATAKDLPTTRVFSAGTLDATAGAYSPFVLQLARPDGSQQISSISATLPPGLLGKLAGIPYCSDSQIAGATARSGEGQGAQEIASPSCPADSEVGTVTALAGAGPEPLSVTGHAYLAGPYKGAPLSLEIITPAIAGPFDLGAVAVRTALQVNPLSAQITAVSDPIPTILHGLPLDLRSIAIDMDRPNFTLNPTSCEPASITATTNSTLGAVTPLSDYFQATNCASLNFKPKLQLRLKGSTKRTGHPALKAVLTYPKSGAYANVKRAQVNLPHSEFIEQNNLNKTCTKPVLLEGKCPAKSIYGKAKAWSPLLEKPLEGNVYLVGGFGFKLPALVAELDGQIRILLAGKVDSGANHGIRNTFEAVPDAPVEKFELNLKGGPKYSLLINSENLCKKPQKAIARFTAQNGKVLQAKPVIANDCKKKSRGGSKKPKGGHKKKAGHGHKQKAAPEGKKHGK